MAFERTSDVQSSLPGIRDDQGTWVGHAYPHVME
jgi:hypothetical protein